MLRNLFKSKKKSNKPYDSFKIKKSSSMVNNKSHISDSVWSLLVEKTDGIKIGDKIICETVDSSISKIIGNNSKDIIFDVVDLLPNYKIFIRGYMEDIHISEICKFYCNGKLYIVKKQIPDINYTPNTAIGYTALNNITTSSKNTSIGRSAIKL